MGRSEFKKAAALEGYSTSSAYYLLYKGIIIGVYLSVAFVLKLLNYMM